MNNNASPCQTPVYKIGFGDYLRFRELITAYSGLHFPERKRLDLEIGLLKALAETTAISRNTPHILDDYYRLLANQNDLKGRAELERLINLLTVGETHFFRDEAQFDALWAQVLPEIIARKRRAAQAVGVGIQPQLRLWSAGCASGEEPYSLAMLLKELIPDIEQWHILILATDINQESLARAQEGLYSEWSFRENRAKILRSRYFSMEMSPNGPQRERYRLSPAIKQMVTLASLNLIKDEYPAIYNNTANMDLIICRNVTIYFTQDDTQRVVNRFHQALVEEGWLVVGHSEPALSTYREFQARTFPGALLYQKTGQPQPWPEDWNWATVDEPSKSQPAHASAPGSKVGGPLTLGSFASPARVELQPSRIKTTPLKPASPNSLSAVAAASAVDPYQQALELLKKGQTPEAIQHLRQKLAVEPNFALAHYLLGRAYADLGDWPEARRWCQKAIALDNLLPQAYYMLSLIDQQDNDLAAAVAMLKKAIYLERNNPLYHFNLAILYQKLNNQPLMQRALENTLRLLAPHAPTDILPEADGATAGHLRQVVEKMLNLTRI